MSAFDDIPGFEDDVSPPTATAPAPNGHAADGPPADITPIRFADLKGKTPPPRRFIVEGWLPAGCVTSLYGPGGVGKSLLAQMLGTAVAVGRELFGFAVEKGPVLGLMCEDDDDELWRRQVRINGYLGCDMDELGDLHLQGRAGLENILAVYPTTGAPTVEAFLEMIREKARELRPVLIILDPIAQMFGGNENDRFQVSHFVNLVLGLARDLGCAVLLLGHPAKPKDSEFSGSTAWNASVRSRLLLQRNKDEENELLLGRVKSNYAPPDTLSLQWTNGILRPTAQELMSAADAQAAGERDGQARTAFLAALDRLAAGGISLSDSSRAGNYAPGEIERHGMLDGFTRREMGRAMIALIARGELAANQPVGRGSSRHQRHGLARPDAPTGVRNGPAQRLRTGSQPRRDHCAPEAGEARHGESPSVGGTHRAAPHRKAKRTKSDLPEPLRTPEVGDTPPPDDEPDEFDL